LVRMEVAEAADRLSAFAGLCAGMLILASIHDWAGVI
jgi:hypothetical protein